MGLGHVNNVNKKNIRKLLNASVTANAPKGSGPAKYWSSNSSAFSLRNATRLKFKISVSGYYSDGKSTIQLYSNGVKVFENTYTSSEQIIETIKFKDLLSEDCYFKCSASALNGTNNSSSSTVTLEYFEDFEIIEK